jgi:GDP-L-fucose synthase
MTGVSILKHLLRGYGSAEIRASCHIARPLIEHKQVKYIQVDLRSLEDCRRILNGCDCAIMAAAHAGGAAFARSFPWEHMKENLIMNMHMLEACRLENIKRIVFIGSSALYQEFDGSIKEEELDFGKEPHEFYFGFGWAMRFIEKLCKLLNRRYGMEIIMVRAANIFGPYDKFNPEVSNFIPALIRKAVDRIDPFEVWGAPDVTRDVIYADDFARAIVMLVDNDRIKFDVFNIGSEVKTAVCDIVKWALKYAGYTPSEVKYLRDKPTTIKFRALDCTKAHALLGWIPEISPEEGVKRTVNWWLENKSTWNK